MENHNCIEKLKVKIIEAGEEYHTLSEVKEVTVSGTAFFLDGKGTIKTSQEVEVFGFKKLRNGSRKQAKNN